MMIGFRLAFLETVANGGPAGAPVEPAAASRGAGASPAAIPASGRVAWEHGRPARIPAMRASGPHPRAWAKSFSTGAARPAPPQPVRPAASARAPTGGVRNSLFDHLNYDAVTRTLPEAARKVQRDPEAVRRWIRQGHLRARKVGTQYLIEDADLPPMNAGTVPLRKWLQHTACGDPMPDVVAIIRRQRQGR